jgi:hypothetical protein
MIMLEDATENREFLLYIIIWKSVFLFGRKVVSDLKTPASAVGFAYSVLVCMVCSTIFLSVLQNTRTALKNEPLRFPH